MKGLALFLLLTLPLLAESIVLPVSERPAPKPDWKRWGISVVAHFGATAIDYASSRGRYESNPRLRNAQGQLGWSGAAKGFGILAATIGVQYLILRKWPTRHKRVVGRVFEASNYGFAVAHLVVARQNTGVPTIEELPEYLRNAEVKP